MAVKITNQIRKYLLDELSAGDLPPTPSHRLPTERSLAKKFDTSRATVRQALTVLEVEGWVERRAGSGTYLRAVDSSKEISALNPSSLSALLTLGSLN